MRKPLIAGNWKMYKIIAEAITLANSIKRELLDFEKVDIVICPSFAALSNTYDVIMDTNIKLGAQDVYWESEGAYTGEVSAEMLKDCGCRYVIVGHSERRKYFLETDEFIHRKVKATLKNNLIPIVCVGETLGEREKNLTIDVIKRQLEGVFAELSEDDMVKLVIAYEPVWAIGTGKTAQPYQAQEVHRFIRGWIENAFSPGCAESMRILYGGSVKPSNIKELMDEPDIDGALVGGASLEANSFVDIVKNSS